MTVDFEHFVQAKGAEWEDRNASGPRISTKLLSSRDLIQTCPSGRSGPRSQDPSSSEPQSSLVTFPSSPAPRLESYSVIVQAAKKLVTESGPMLVRSQIELPEENSLYKCHWPISSKSIWYFLLSCKACLVSSIAFLADDLPIKS
jgi:hypothetical protein